MHFEIPRVSIHSIKEFAGHYLMIVLSILTALGLEQWIESRHHAHAAEAARREMEIELHANLADVRKSLRFNDERLEVLRAFSAGIAEDLKAGRPRADVAKHVVTRFKGLGLVAYSLPSLRHEAWDVAVANQSAGYIDPVALRRLSAAYVGQRDAGTSFQLGVGMFNAPRLIDATTDFEIGSVDPREVLQVMRQVIVSFTVVQGTLTQLETTIGQALPAEAPAGPRPAPAADGAPPAR